MRDWEVSAVPFSAWDGQMRVGERTAAVEAGPISRMAWDFIWLMRDACSVVKKMVSMGYYELLTVTMGYQEGDS